MSKSELFRLIKSLKPAEKRYFKANNKYDSGKNYLRLFDAIDKQSKYNEEALIKEFRNEAFIKHLSSEKTYLQNAILRSMRSYQINNHPLYALRGLIQDAEFLYKRGLHKKCEQLIRKSKKLAYQDEHFLEVLQLLKLEEGLRISYHSGKTVDAERKIYDERQSALRKQKLNYDIINLYNRVYYSRNLELSKGKDLQKYIQSVLDDPLIQNRPIETTFTYEYMHLSILSHCHLMLDDLKSVTHAHEKIIKLLESRNTLRSPWGRIYKLVVYNYIHYHYDYKENTVLQAIKKLQEKPFTTPVGKATDFQLTWTLKTLACLNENDVQRLQAMIPAIETGLKIHHGNFEEPGLLILYDNIISVYFQAGHFSDCIPWIQKIKSANFDTRRDNITMAWLLDLIIHFETSEPEILQYVISNCEHYLKECEALSDFQIDTFSLIRELSYEDRKKWHPALMGFKGKWLPNYQKKSLRPVGLENILVWVESKLQKRPIKTITKSRIKNKNSAISFEPVDSNVKEQSREFERSNY